MKVVQSLSETQGNSQHSLLTFNIQNFQKYENFPLVIAAQHHVPKSHPKGMG